MTGLGSLPEMITAMIKVRHRLGLHARPAAVFVQTANSFQSQISVKNASTNQGPVDAKSILGVLTLGVSQGHDITLAIAGPDAEEAMAALCYLVDSNFGEAESG